MSSYTVCKTFMHICIHIYLHMYTYLCVCSICLYLCSPFLFDFGYWHLGSKSFEGTWMDRQLLSDWAATGFSQCLGGIKWSFMEILIQILQGFHPGNHPGIYCEHGIFPHASWGKHNWKLPPPPNWKFGKLWSSQPGHARWLWWFKTTWDSPMGPPGLLTKLQQAQFGSLETALETEALETGQTPVMCFGSGHQMATCQVFFRGGKGWTHKTITRLEVSGFPVVTTGPRPFHRKKRRLTFFTWQKIWTFDMSHMLSFRSVWGSNNKNTQIIGQDGNPKSSWNDPACEIILRYLCWILVGKTFDSPSMTGLCTLTCLGMQLLVLFQDL